MSDAQNILQGARDSRRRIANSITADDYLSHDEFILVKIGTKYPVRERLDKFRGHTINGKVYIHFSELRPEVQEEIIHREAFKIADKLWDERLAQVTAHAEKNYMEKKYGGKFVWNKPTNSWIRKRYYRKGPQYKRIWHDRPAFNEWDMQQLERNRSKRQKLAHDVEDAIISDMEEDDL